MQGTSGRNRIAIVGSGDDTEGAWRNGVGDSSHATLLRAVTTTIVAGVEWQFGEFRLSQGRQQNRWQ